MERIEQKYEHLGQLVKEKTQQLSNSATHPLSQELIDKCEQLVDDTLTRLKEGKLKEALSFVVELDQINVSYPTSPYLIFVYLIRAEVAYLYDDWCFLQEYCELGINLASRNKQLSDVGHFYLVLLQKALYRKQYELAINYSRLALFFKKKGNQQQPNFRHRCHLSEMLAYIGLGQLENAQKIVRAINHDTEQDPLAILVCRLISEVYVLAINNGQGPSKLMALLDELWEMKQFSLVKLIANFLMDKFPQQFGLKQFEHYLLAFEMNESTLNKLEELAYNDHLRAVYITNDNDEKIGFHSGESYRSMLNEQFMQVEAEQYVTFVTFIIKVNEPDLLSRHLQVKYDLYMQIDRDLSKFFKGFPIGKYYPTSFCVMLVSEKPVDIVEIGEQCQRYLDQIELEIEGKAIHYNFYGGASTKQRQQIDSLHKLYQEADQNMYYAQVTKKPIVLFEGEG